MKISRRVFSKLSSLSLRRRSVPTTVAVEWREIEYFDPVWNARVEEMASLISIRGCLVDFGCGNQSLRDYLPDGVSYVPVDYTPRSTDTVVIDFNAIGACPIKGDIAFASGFLEYLVDPERFLNQLASLGYQQIVLSYCLIEKVSCLEQRRSLGWKNDMSLRAVLNSLLGDFALTKMREHGKNTILRFDRLSV